MIKSNDLALIILIIAITLVGAWFGAGAIINSPDNRSQEVEIIRPIGAEFSVPPVGVFNDEAINPAQSITIQPGNQDQPFIDGE